MHYHLERSPWNDTCWGNTKFIHTLIGSVRLKLKFKFKWDNSSFFFFLFTGSWVLVQKWQLSEGDKCWVCAQQQLVHHIPVRHRCSTGNATSSIWSSVDVKSQWNESQYDSSILFQAYKYLREEVKTFQGKPIMVSKKKKKSCFTNCSFIFLCIFLLVFFADRPG